VVFQKQFTTALRRASEKRARRRPERARAGTERNPLRSPALVGSLGAASVYGGYFTAAQGVLYLGILGVFTGRSMGSVNSIKNLMSLGGNLPAAVVHVLAFFLFDAEIVWLGSLAIAVGSLLGEFFGAHLAKRLPECVLRRILVVVALFALAREVLCPLLRAAQRRNGSTCARTSSGEKSVPPWSLPGRGTNSASGMSAAACRDSSKRG